MHKIGNPLLWNDSDKNSSIDNDEILFVSATSNCVDAMGLHESASTKLEWF